jgi:uncharacterized protein (DUF58 family)
MKAKIPALLFSLVVFSAALLVNVPQTRVFLFILSLVPFVSVVLSGLIPRWIILEREEKEISINRFKPFSIELTLINKSPFPIQPFLVSDRIDNLYTKDPPVFLIGLAPFEKKTISYLAEGNERGFFTIGPAECSGKDTLRFFSWKKGSRQKVKVLILPATIPVLLLDSGGSPGGMIHNRSPLNEDTTRYESVRPYREGDNIRRINWKATARLNRLMTTEYESSLSIPVAVFLNFDEQDFKTRYKTDMLEKAVEAAASLAYEYSGKKQNVSFFSNGMLPDGSGSPVCMVPPAGTDFYIPIVKNLALLKNSTTCLPFTDLVSLYGTATRRSRVFLITPFLSPEKNNLLFENFHRTSQYFFIHLSDFDTAPAEKQFVSLRGIHNIVIKTRGKEPLHES